MQHVFVVDNQRKPLMPCHPARARQLLNEGRAAVLRRYPFTIMLKDVDGGAVQPVTIKIDPGSKQTGIALVANQRVIWAAVLEHRGQLIRAALETRRALRRGRRNRKTRYRPARFNNRTASKPEGWLAPSLMSRVYNIMTWAARLERVTPITDIAMERVKFDTQLMKNPEISGIEYQQGTLQGYEVREYLLEKWGRKCAYCGAENVRLEIEHIIPKARGGTQSVNNLAIACNDCNQDKGSKTAAEYGFPDIQKQAQATMKDAAAVNATRWKLFHRLEDSGLPVEVGTGARTKYNRIRQGYEKTHWIDAACVGQSGECVYIDPQHKPLLIRAMGHGNRRMCMTDKYGFPRQHRTRQKTHYGFKTGDMVIAVPEKGKYAGRYVGRVTTRASGKFDVKTSSGMIQANARYCRAIHRSDGYRYETMNKQEDAQS